MFTGIVLGRGRIRDLVRAGGPEGGVRLAVVPDAALAARTGDSVSVDGVCLTVVRVEGGALLFDVVPETLRRTTLGHRDAGDRVNLEPALRVGDALGGHLVQGHVEGVGTVEGVERRGEDVRMTIGVAASLQGAVIPKGSVTLDGVSLTVGEVTVDGFSVYLVPHTLAVTGLGERRPGDRVNVEPDLIGRWVEHHVARRHPRPT